MKQIFFLIVLCFGLSYLVQGQDNIPDAIFFRVPDLQQKIDRAEASNKTNEAVKTRNIANAMREAIIKDFRLNFVFCPVFFIKESESYLIKTNDWSRITFWNHKGEKVKPEKPSNYLIANFGVKPPVYGKAEDGKDIVINNVQGSLEDGIVLRDAQLVPIQSKFMFTIATLKKKGLGFLKPNSLDFVFYGAFKLEQMLNAAFIGDEIAPKDE